MRRRSAFSSTLPFIGLLGALVGIVKGFGAIAEGGSSLGAVTIGLVSFVGITAAGALVAALASRLSDQEKRSQK
jgi:flagellar motor component MotA